MYTSCPAGHRDAPSLTHLLLLAMSLTFHIFVQGGDMGAETITVTDMGNFIYAIFIYDYRPVSSYPLSQSGANMAVYGSIEGFLQFGVPVEEPVPGANSRHWMVGCLKPDSEFQVVNLLLSDGLSEPEIAQLCTL